VLAGAGERLAMRCLLVVDRGVVHGSAAYDGGGPEPCAVDADDDVSIEREAAREAEDLGADEGTSK
jgi:hypothetical protein